MANHYTRQIPDLSEAQEQELQRWVRRAKTAQALVLRARIVLQTAAGKSDMEVAGQLGTTRATVGKWRRRFLRDGCDGLLDEPRPGAPRTIGDDDVERVVVQTLETIPAGATHWSTRSMAKACGLSAATVSRIWRAFGLKPPCPLTPAGVMRDCAICDRLRRAGRRLGRYSGCTLNSVRSRSSCCALASSVGPASSCGS